MCCKIAYKVTDSGYILETYTEELSTGEMKLRNSMTFADVTGLVDNVITNSKGEALVYWGFCGYTCAIHMYNRHEVLFLSGAIRNIEDTAAAARLRGVSKYNVTAGASAGVFYYPEATFID